MIETGREVFSGHELVIRGALESRDGFSFLTGCRRNPVSGFFDVCDDLQDILVQYGVQVREEEHPTDAAAVFAGSMLMQQRAILTLSADGMHKASDTIARGMFTHVQKEAAALIICSDQRVGPAANAQADMRFLAEHLRMPLLEPSNGQEVKDWIEAGFQLSQTAGMYVGYLLADTLLDGGASVHVKPWGFEKECAIGIITPGTDEEEPAKQLKPLTFIDKRIDRVTRKRHALITTEALRLGVNTIHFRPQKDEIAPIGFVASGMGYAYLTHVLDIMGLRGRYPILKLGLSYPLDSTLITAFASQCDELVVIEEGRRFIERQISEILQPLQQSEKQVANVWGQSFPDNLPGIPFDQALHPSILMSRLAALFEKIDPSIPQAINIRIARELKIIEQANNRDINLADRTPTFCPGCPQRDVAMVVSDLKKDISNPAYMRRQHKEQPFELIVHGDEGCNTMMGYAPHDQIIHSFIGGGLGAASSAGVELFADHQQIIFMGDQSFLASGQLAVRRSIEQGQNITYIIMENKTSPPSVLRRFWASKDDIPKTHADRIELVIKQMTPRSPLKDVRVVRTRMDDYHSFREAVEEAVLEDGIKIIVCDKVCGVTYHQYKANTAASELATRGYLQYKKFQNVTTEVCEACMECTVRTGCPGLTLTDTDYGPKVQTDLNWCMNDQACSRIDVCPSFEQVIVTRIQPAFRPDRNYIKEHAIPSPRPMHADSDTWRCQLAGVAGLGIGLSTQVLVRAGRAMGYNVRYVEDKGRAIGSGGVFSQILFTRENRAPVISPIIPYGKADLLIGLDSLEAARSMDPKHRYRVVGEQTTVVINTLITPTVLSMMNQDELDLDIIERPIRDVVAPENYHGVNISDICDKLFGRRTYANMMMLGLAYQLSYIPLTLDALEGAISEIFGVEADANLRAFRVGRQIAESPRGFLTNEDKPKTETTARTIRRLYHSIKYRDRKRWFGRSKARASAFTQLANRACDVLTRRHASTQLQKDIIVRIHDCLIWGGGSYAKQYLKRVLTVFEEDQPTKDYALTQCVIKNLARVMLIKDELYVSAMLTSPTKVKRDQKRFNIHPHRGDRMKYRRVVKPEFVFLKQRFGFELSARPWMLRTFAKMRWLRKIMPTWHAQDRAFRKWYWALLDSLKIDQPDQYQRWIEILSLPEQVTGFRNIRYPKIVKVYEQAEQLLEQLEQPQTETSQPETPKKEVSLSTRIIES